MGLIGILVVIIPSMPFGTITRTLVEWDEWWAEVPRSTKAVRVMMPGDPGVAKVADNVFVPGTAAIDEVDRLFSKMGQG